MEEFDCLKCKKENEVTERFFGDDIECKFCGAIHETDFDYDD